MVLNEDLVSVVVTDIKRKLNLYITCLLLALKQYCTRVPH